MPTSCFLIPYQNVKHTVTRLIIPLKHSTITSIKTSWFKFRRMQPPDIHFEYRPQSKIYFCPTPCCELFMKLWAYLELFNQHFICSKMKRANFVRKQRKILRFVLIQITRILLNVNSMCINDVTCPASSTSSYCASKGMPSLFEISLSVTTSSHMLNGGTIA